MASELMTYWERCAEKRWGKHLSEFEHKLVAYAVSMTRGPGAALEIGCEGGRWSRLLSESGWGITCTDVDEKVLEVCQARIPKAKCILVKPTDKELPVRSNTIRLMLCIEVWELAHKRWLFAEAHRALEDGGLLVITCPNRLSWRGTYSFLRGTAGKWYPGTYSGWKRKAQESGFEILMEEGYAWCPFQRASDSRWVGILTRLEIVLRLRYLTVVSPWVGVVVQKTQPAPYIPPAGT